MHQWNTERVSAGDLLIRSMNRHWHIGTVDDAQVIVSVRTEVSNRVKPHLTLIPTLT